MNRGIIQAICGEGCGKTSAALGKSIQAVSAGKKVVFITFLKGKQLDDYACTVKLEPDLKVFCFEKGDVRYSELPEEKKEEEKINIINGFHFAAKVVETGECDLLVMDEVLGLIDLGIITIQDLYRIIEHSRDGISFIITGRRIPKELIQHIDIVSEIVQLKNNV